MIILIFIIGLCVGSFLNVVVDRPMQRRSVVFGRSSCDFCKHELSWRDLIPILSYLFLQGRCRYCHKKLSSQYPLVEFCTALSFCILYFLLPNKNPLFLIFSFGLLSSGIALFLSDTKYQLLPNGSMTFFAIFSLLIILYISPDSFFLRLFVAMLSSLLFLLLFLFSKGKAMGFGDVKLSFLMGFLLNFPGVVIAFYTAFLTGAVVGIILILRRKVRLHGGKIAFGPFLLIGTIVGLIWGNYLWHYFKTLMGF